MGADGGGVGCQGVSAAGPKHVGGKWCSHHTFVFVLCRQLNSLLAAGLVLVTRHLAPCQCTFQTCHPPLSL
jgi:hypothetical protein